MLRLLSDCWIKNQPTKSGVQTLAHEVNQERGTHYYFEQLLKNPSLLKAHKAK